ncbi:YheC/YheD family protein [Thermoflavimicrobium daqui]|uniref:YheC/D like ATP-grasp n=1 Tax=Thermoflavimicrobium daqui TaxID=2137476 RepID=A0A364K4T2_9BACL|nr:YheC/YheD family protein [Thermoflavimicrobium daqui]RAL24375.1 hypothetical protein DL897_08595 [Thermoflavimicrobium daqui]
MSVISKMNNAKLLAKNPLLTPHIPTIERLSQYHLKNMLRSFPTIYLKPDNSCQGKGIMRITRHPNGSYLLQIKNEPLKWIYTKVFPLWQKILQLKMKRSYVIQQGIDSFTFEGKLFDIRVHMIRTNNEWIIGGIIGRIAPKDSIVTNAYSGGISKKITPLLTEDLKLDPTQAQQIIHSLSTISIEAAQTISHSYPKWSEFGLDIGIDSDKHLWLYEINIKPGLLVFKTDKKTYENILKLREYAT